MKRIYRLFIIKSLILMFALSSSCNKLLDVEMPNNQINKNQIFESTQTANAALSALYASLVESGPITGSSAGIGFYLGYYTDEIQALNLSDNSYVFYLNQLQASNNSIKALWQSSFEKIYAANAILEGVEASPKLSVSDKQRIRGEALMVRSFLFFYLEQLFGDIPFPETTDYRVNQVLPKRVSQNVLTILENNLKESAVLLSDDYRNVERIFPNKKVVQLLLAKVLMAQSKWKEAETILRAILQSPLYHFEQDVKKVFQKSGTHILWQLKPKNAGDPTKEAMLWYLSSNTAPTLALSEDLLKVFEGKDLRIENWMTMTSFNQKTWYLSGKYKNVINNTTEYSIVFRLEEVYLLLAEALVQQDEPAKMQEALPFLNATRVRAGLDLLIGQFVKQQLIDELLLENRREFFSELGHRFFDLKRTGRLNMLKVVKPNWKEGNELWPLPESELVLNTNLLPQNYGY